MSLAALDPPSGSAGHSAASDTPANPLHWFLRHPFAPILLLTLLAAVLRFSFLTKPPLWADEAYTYSRVCGSFRDMVDVLRYDGFPPLHYEAYWLLARVCRLTPVQMRLIPAAAGTLMIPAMYFLAIQMTRRRTALLAALFTCFSAYLLAYSRDAKMYPAAWLFTTLHVACLLWWLRTGLRIAWLAWAACGLAMTGLHLATLAILPVDLLILMTLLRGRVTAILTRALAFALGILLILGALYGYEYRFNRWAQRNDEQGFSAASGLAWVEMVNAGRTGPDLALSASTAYLYGWEWPGGIVGFFGQPPSPHIPHAGMISGTIVLLLLGAGAIAWPRFRNIEKQADPDPGCHGHVLMPVPSSPSSILHPPSSPSTPPWRPLLWLSFWIVIPACGAYCASMRHFASPFDWLVRFGDLVAGRWLIVVPGIVLLAALLQFVPKLLPYVAAVIPVAALVLLGTSTYSVLHTVGKPLTFESAYWPIASRWWDAAMQPGVLIAPLILLPVIAWYAAAPATAVRIRKAGALLLVAAIIFVSCFAIYGIFTYRFERRVRLLLVDHHTVPSWNVLVFMSLRDHGVPATQVAIQEVRESAPNLAPSHAEQRAAASVTAAQRRWDDLARSAGADPQPQRRAAERLAAERVVWDEWVSVWQPRYLGMIWPAVAIAACALLLRLPTRPFRYTAIALVIALNLTQAISRITAQTELPADRIAADVAASQDLRAGHPTGTDIRTWLDGLMGFAVGDRMSNADAQLRYYLAQISGQRVTPKDFRETPYPVSGTLWKPWDLRLLYNRSPRDIACDLEASPHIRRAIIWDTGIGNDAILKQLGPAWRLAGEQTFKYRLHWTWSEFRQYRRREFVRVSQEAQK